MEMQRSGCSLTVLFPLSFFFLSLCMCACVCDFSYPLLISVPSFSTSHSSASSLFYVHFLFFFCMLLLSLAWNGDWKPPKVWRNCKSQKQPAQQPCKSTRNLLEKKKATKAERWGSVFYLWSPQKNTLPTAGFSYPLHCPTDVHKCLSQFPHWFIFA